MKKCLVIVNTHKEESLAMEKVISAHLFERGIETSAFYFDGFSEEGQFEGYDFVITLGGDGTVLFAARNCVKSGIPVFPVNFGEFGFIASVQKENWQSEVDAFLSGRAEFDERSMLNAALISKKNRDFSGIGLNDVVISAKSVARTILFDVSYNDVSLGTFKADGIIISTATGSTAYSASAGGPIIDPDLDALVLTPVNSFSLSSRPLVLSPKGEIGVTILSSREKNALITIDGQRPFELEIGDTVKIRRLQKKVRLIGCNTKKFYGALRSKLNWSGGPHA